MASNLFAERLNNAIQAVCPIIGISIGVIGDSNTVRIDFHPSATSQQQTDARTTLAAFDWRESAQQAWETARIRQRAKSDISVQKAIRAVALVMLDEINLLRTRASLAERTVNQLVNAIEAKIDNL